MFSKTTQPTLMNLPSNNSPYDASQHSVRMAKFLVIWNIWPFLLNAHCFVLMGKGFDCFQV